METLKYCLYGSVVTIMLGLAIYIFILRSHIKKLTNQINNLKAEIESYKAELLTQQKDSELKLIELTTELEYLKKSQKNAKATQEKIEKIDTSTDVVTDINNLIKEFNEKNK